MSADKRAKLLPGIKRGGPADTVHGYFRCQPRAERKMFAEPEGVANKIKVIGLINQGANGICPTQLIDYCTRFSRVNFDHV